MKNTPLLFQTPKYAERRTALVALACAILAGAQLYLGVVPIASAASAASTYDGVWGVNLVCSDVREGKRVTLGYSFQFNAKVEDGFLRGEYRSEGTPGWMRLEGAIADDGTGILDARGLTNDPEYSVGQVAKSTRYAYHVRVRFDEKQGTGTRVELRPCDFRFMKR